MQVQGEGVKRERETGREREREGGRERVARQPAVAAVVVVVVGLTSPDEMALT